MLSFQGATVDDVQTARLLIEPAAVAALAGTVTPEQLDRLRELVAAARGETGVSRTRALGEQFHAALVGMTGNSTMGLFAQLVQNLISGHTDRYEQHRVRVGAPSQAARLLDAHERVINLLEAGAAQEAAKLVRAPRRGAPPARHGCGYRRRHRPAAVTPCPPGGP
jgi:DNA-binding GntR family transcriptional regulator